jgi:DNA-directed RNA polymerase specialized sigma24 family protein
MHECQTNAELLAAWRAGDERAADVLFQRYLVRLTALARARLSQRLAQRVDPEDLVLSAYRSFFIGARDGRFQPGADDDLWPLLVTVTLRKLSKHARLHSAECRAVGKEAASLNSAFAECVSNEPSPDEAAVVADELQHLLNTLSGPAREVVIRQLNGDDPATIARELACSERTVRRIVAQVRAQLAEGLVSVEACSNDSSTLVRQSTARGLTGIHREQLSDDAQQQPTHRLQQLILHEMISQGGFSKVFRATDRATSQFVAVKFLRKSLWQDLRASQGLKREFAALSSLRHPNILHVLGWGLAPGGAIFLVSELLDGQTLAAWRELDSPPVAAIAEVLSTVAEALTAAHASGILHGDLKPQNVMRRQDGRIVLMDFGMARWFQRVDDQPPRGGSVGFLSPEQVSAAFGELTEQTDVYAWGALAYALLTGHPPLLGRDLPETIARVLSSALPPNPSILNPNVPAEFASLILRCLSKDQAERPATPALVRSELLAWWR